MFLKRERYERRLGERIYGCLRLLEDRRRVVRSGRAGIEPPRAEYRERHDVRYAGPEQSFRTQTSPQTA
jgi:hypothetical protein